MAEEPAPVPGIGPVASARSGYRALTTCAIDMTKQVWCWGRNENGTLGHAASENNGDIKVAAAPHLAVRSGVANASTPYNANCLTPVEGNSNCYNPAVINGPRFQSIDSSHVVAGGTTASRTRGA